MAHMMSVEKSRFINDNIDIYTKNKVGQYSKFLEKNPIFVTYYHINQAETRTDVGMGAVESDLGPRSPVRFNKILEFPLYNIPELKPDIVFDETGYDIELDMSDIPILPGTIKPTPGDYVLLSFPGIKRYLFRVNQIAYNTIQSNDFYTISMDIKYIDADIDEELIESQVVQTYQTIFENIGTQDRCFVLVEDIEKINQIVDLFYTMRDYYVGEYYLSDINSFSCMTNKVDECCNLIRLYDPYLETFINKSKIFFDENSEKTLLLAPNDVLDKGFEAVFNKSLYNAVLKHSTLQLSKFQYCYDTKITKNMSLYKLYDYTANSIKLFISKIDIRPYLYPTPELPDEDDDTEILISDMEDSESQTNVENTQNEDNAPATPLTENTSDLVTTESDDSSQLNIQTDEDFVILDDDDDFIIEEETYTISAPDWKMYSINASLDGNLEEVEEDVVEDVVEEPVETPEEEVPTVPSTPIVPAIPITPNMPIWEKILPLPDWKETWTMGLENIYFPIELLEALKDGTEPPDDYFSKFIYNYMYDIPFEISRKELYEEAEKDQFRTFRYLPIILYIITELYNERFHNIKALDLP